MNSNSTALLGREWNGATINQRVSDGFVCATTMCQANNKRWENYFRNERTQEYIAALAETLSSAAEARNRATGIDDLIQVRKGGQPELQGTWVHPRLAVDLARWISPRFAVFVDGLILSWIQGQQQQATEWPPEWVAPHAYAAEHIHGAHSVWGGFRQAPWERFHQGSEALKLALVLVLLVERMDAGKGSHRTAYVMAHCTARLFSHYSLALDIVMATAGDDIIQRLALETANALRASAGYQRVVLPRVPSHGRRRSVAVG
jgi:hypothetical protein